MLMLVVTIIVAAVVSGFAGGLLGGASKAPTLAMDIRIVNTGSWIGSGFYGAVTGSSDAIATSKVKIVTAWTTTRRTDGTSIHGGNTSIGGVNNVYCFVGMKTNSPVYSTAPYGIGAGVLNQSVQDATNYHNKPYQYFGNYSLIQGTSLLAIPYGTTSGQAIGGNPGQSDTSGYGVTTPYTYTTGGNYADGQIDATQAVLGTGWENLQPGDIVTVKAIYIPTGQTLLSKTVSVQGG
ncbi:type IV pilin [Methanoregula sp.]|uniref:type IV pilin n=1 Tax=Methanoregula sp. TaxID=2052170 RepID=UPI00356547BF